MHQFPAEGPLPVCTDIFRHMLLSPVVGLKQNLFRERMLGKDCNWPPNTRCPTTGRVYKFCLHSRTLEYLSSLSVSRQRCRRRRCLWIEWCWLQQNKRTIDDDDDILLQKSPLIQTHTNIWLENKQRGQQMKGPFGSNGDLFWYWPKAMTVGCSGHGRG